MTTLGAAAFAVGVVASILVARRSSRVERWIDALGHRERTPTRRPLDRHVTERVAGALCGATAGAAFAWLVGGNILPIAVATYAGAVAPAVIAERREAARAREAERACVTAVEWLCALVAAGRPIETAVARVAARGSSSTLLNEALGRARRDYTLGVPLHVAIAREGASARIVGLIELGARLERARTLGRGAAPLLEDLRHDQRAAERARALRAASGVEGKLTLVMTLCYLPALALLVIVPLFLTLLNGLFA
ncbi:MAG TPA: type II secretion system F family protein [Candidatus Acidoferrales bacterium]|nr:type II secretion system F family protein [Candidatus Acidoferrales bacterium]